VLMSFNILVNEGRYMRPTLVREVLDSEGHVVKPFEPELKWDITKDPLITVYDENNLWNGEYKTVDSWVVQYAKEAMRAVVVEGTGMALWDGSPVTNSAGKTGTAEYCDRTAWLKGLCIPGSWPAHAWTTLFAPSQDPEVSVIAFIYNGTEGSIMAGPLANQALRLYYEIIKGEDITLTGEDNPDDTVTDPDPNNLEATPTGPLNPDAP